MTGIRASQKKVPIRLLYRTCGSGCMKIGLSGLTDKVLLHVISESTLTGKFPSVRISITFDGKLEFRQSTKSRKKTSNCITGLSVLPCFSQFFINVGHVAKRTKESNIFYFPSKIVKDDADKNF